MGYRGGQWVTLAASGTFKQNEGGIFWAAVLSSGTSTATAVLLDDAAGTSGTILKLKAPANDSRCVKGGGHRYENKLYASLTGDDAQISVFIEG